MLRFVPCSLAFILVLAPLALADDPPGASAAARAHFGPGPGAGQAFLRKFEGEWVVHKKFFPPSGEPIRAKGTCRQTMIQGGRFLRSDFQLQYGTGPAPTIGQGLIGFEPETGRFTSVWSDSRSNRFSFRQGRDPFDGKQIVLFSQTLDPTSSPRENRRTRTVTRLEDDGKRIVHQQFTPDADGGERLMMELRMERRPAGKLPPKNDAKESSSARSD